MTKAVLFYTDNCLNMKLAVTCRNQLAKAVGDIPIYSVSLKPMKFGQNIHIAAERSYKTMFKQILAGLEAITEDVVYFCEHDVLYHPSHFDLCPSTPDHWLYNGNYWMVRLTDGFAIKYDVSPLSGLIVYRESAIKHFKERLALIEKKGFGYWMGFEPFTHNRVPWEYKCPFEVSQSAEPNIDLAHEGNLTKKRWRQSQFVRKPKFWIEGHVQDLWCRNLWPFPRKPIPKSDQIELSILIPANNEIWLGRTLEDILQNIELNTEIIVILDGWTIPIPQLPVDDRIRVITNPQSVGQRAATNQACRLSNAKYICKVDAHCAFDKGFDRKLIELMQPNYTMVPIMRNLHVFNWVCPDGHSRYQSPSGPCTYEISPGVQCGKPTNYDVVWIPKTNPQSVAYCFDEEPHFQYFNEYKNRPEYNTVSGLTDTMSLQGSFFLCEREKYWELNLCDESFGSWGSQGIEVACKTWLSGGRVVVNHNTWYAHLFRTQGGDFGFPYEQSGRKVHNAKKMVREVFFDNKWPGQKLPLSWLVEKFWPVPGWTEEMRQKLRDWPLQTSN